MVYNHYVKIRRIINNQPNNWYIRLIYEPTKAKNFRGEIKEFNHYYRIYNNQDQPIKYCKFQQIDRFLSVMKLKYEDLNIVE